MAFPTAVVWEVQTGGSDTANGGAFNPSNASMATDLTTDSNTANTSAPVVSSASYNFVAGDAGHWVFIQSGTNWIPGWYKIASVASNKATLNGTAGTAVLWNGTNLLSYTPNTATGCASTGTPTGGVWTIDYSQGASPYITYSDASAAGSGSTFTSSANPVGKNIIGNVVVFTGGTNVTTGRYEITSTSGTTATVSGAAALTTGATSNGAGGLGGALASWGKAASLKSTDQCVFIKSGTYTCTSSSTNVAGGLVVDATTPTSRIQPTFWWGYQTYRGDDGARPVFNCNGVPTFANAFYANAHLIVRCLEIDCGGAAKYMVGFKSSGNDVTFYKLKALNMGGDTGFFGSSSTTMILCQATGGVTAGYAFETRGARMYGCEAWGNAFGGFTGDSSFYYHCLSYSNTGSSIGFNTTWQAVFIGCVAYGNAGGGFSIGGTVYQPSALIGCIAEGNTGYGVKSSAAQSDFLMTNCAFYNNSSGPYDRTQIPLRNVIACVEQSAGSFFTNAASGDFSLNSTAGQGALARATGFPGTFPRGTTVGYPDIGAAQHQDSGSGGGAATLINGGLVG